VDVITVAAHSVTPAFHHLSADPHVVPHSGHLVTVHGTHSFHHSTHAVLARAPHPVAFARLRSPVAADLDVLRPILTLLTSLFGCCGFAQAALVQFVAAPEPSRSEPELFPALGRAWEKFRATLRIWCR
jgi:hypothetical protein